MNRIEKFNFSLYLAKIFIIFQYKIPKIQIHVSQVTRGEQDFFIAMIYFTFKSTEVVSNFNFTPLNNKNWIKCNIIGGYFVTFFCYCFVILTCILLYIRKMFVFYSWSPNFNLLSILYIIHQKYRQKSYFFRRLAYFFIQFLCRQNTFHLP